MREHPYNEAYVDEIVETQGRLFGGIQDDHGDCDGIDFMRSYMTGSTRAHLDKGDAYLANLSSKELKSYFIDADSYRFKPGEPVRGFVADWIGRFYARYQWEFMVPSARLLDEIPIDWLRVAYAGLHDLSLNAAVDKVHGVMPTQGT